MLADRGGASWSGKVKELGTTNQRNSKRQETFSQRMPQIEVLEKGSTGSMSIARVKMGGSNGVWRSASMANWWAGGERDQRSQREGKGTESEENGKDEREGHEGRVKKSRSGGEAAPCPMRAG